MANQSEAIRYNRGGIADIGASLHRMNLWLRLGVRDLLLEHARASLGALWPLIGAAVWISIIYFLLGSSLGEGNPNYLAYLTIGVVIYNFASGIIVNGVQCFLRFKGVILNIPNPLFIYPLRLFVNVSASTLMQVVFIVAAIIICGIQPTIAWLYLIPGIAALAITGIFIALIMGILGVFIGDLRFLMQSVMRMLMFATPIFWYASDNPVRMVVSHANPLAHYIAIIRDPLLGQPVQPLTVYVVLGCTIASVLIGLALFSKSRNNIVRKL